MTSYWIFYINAKYVREIGQKLVRNIENEIILLGKKMHLRNIHLDCVWLSPSLQISVGNDTTLLQFKRCCKEKEEKINKDHIKWTGDESNCKCKTSVILYRV